MSVKNSWDSFLGLELEKDIQITQKSLVNPSLFIKDTISFSFMINGFMIKRAEWKFNAFLPINSRYYYSPL